MAHRVGIQVGHWLTDEAPDEVSGLRTVEGVKSGGLDETIINRQVAQQVAEILVRAGIEVDILPTTVPEAYRADLFIALHVDAYDDDPTVRGFKVARSSWSRDPEMDDALSEKLATHYMAATGVPENRDTISDKMTEYYAFNYAEIRHAISPLTPAAIIEMGFLSNDLDREILVEKQQLIAKGIAGAVMEFLASKG